VDFDIGKLERTATPAEQSRPGLRLHPDYTFDNFVVGPSNRLAHASCVAVSQSPGNTYNPLFIYGSSGLGKTHLLHAVCFGAHGKFDGAVIQFLSCEDFVNRFIRAIEEGNLPGFQSQFRTVDMLVIDDIQFLREREHSQEEFLARKIQANIRELEGALTTIYAVANTTGEEITFELAQTALEGQIKLAARHISITDIIEAVTRHFDVRLADLQSKKRSQSITEPRQICMYLARNLTKHSLEEIGGHLGGRDHTTVMHACSKIGESERSDPQMHALLAELSKQITQTPQT